MWNFVDRALQNEADISVLERCKPPREAFDHLEKYSKTQRMRWRLRSYMTSSVWGTRFAILSCTKRGLVYIRLGYWGVDTDVVGGLNWLLLYVVHSLI